jgi:imidazolonepropionase-like amidohydrolase
MKKHAPPFPDAERWQRPRVNLAFSLLAIGVGLATLACAAPNEKLALRGATIYASPDQPPIPNGVVVIENGKIAAVGSGASVKIPNDAQKIDCSGLTITAGFWNSHVHFTERKWEHAANIPAADLGRQLQDMLTRYGFTSVFDLSSVWENTRLIRDRVESGEVPGPKIRSTGLGLNPANAGPPPLQAMAFMGWMGFSLTEVADGPQATAAVKALLDSGADGIKLFASSLPTKVTMAPAAMEAAVSEAHRRGKPVFVHPNTGSDVLAAARAGVDVIVHTTPASGPWDETIVAEMKKHGVALIPTLWIWKYYARHDPVAAQDRTIDTELAQVRKWMAAGGTLLFGTDLGATDPDPSEEYKLMAQAGMSFPQILASLTTAPAARFGESKETGRIAAGFQADLAIVKGDPAKDIQALAAVEYTLRAGKIIYRAPH